MDSGSGTIEQLTRQWDSAYNIWIDKGMPDNDPNYPFPGDHPDPNNRWNMDRELFIRNLRTDAAEEYMNRVLDNREEIDEY